MSRDIQKVVDSVLKRSPLPENYQDLVPVQRRQIEREAQAALMAPAAYWSVVRAEAATRLADEEGVSQVASGVAASLRPVR